jgi:hypothetical protein
MTECNELTRYVMRSHAGFDADEAWRNVRKSCGNPDLFMQYDRAFLIQANHMRRIVAGSTTWILPSRLATAGSSTPAARGRYPGAADVPLVASRR